MKIKKDELEKYVGDMGTYAIVKYEDGSRECIWISRYKNLLAGEDYILEAPCDLKKYTLIEDIENCTFAQVKEAVESYLALWEETSDYEPWLMRHIEGNVSSIMQKGYYYDIDCPQTSPFLPNEFEIKFIGEAEAIEFLKNW